MAPRAGANSKPPKKNFAAVATKIDRTTVPANLEIGDSGTKILDGIVREEYNSKLADTRGIAVFDEMRKSDGTVIAAVKAVSLPVRSATWYVKSASDDQTDIDIADFVKACLFEYQELTFDDFLRQALLSLPFGVMVFEKVYGTQQIDGQTRIVFTKLAPRMPASIRKWAIGQNQPGITQTTSDGTVVEIPMEKLLVFVNEKEGDNWWGTSILRAAYKHWFIKNTIYKIDAIAFERQGLGIPYVKLPEGATKNDATKAEALLQNIRANSHAYIVEPFEYEMGFKDMQSDKTRDPQNSLAHHNREIMKSVLAQFLELGASSSSGSSGSRALSQDHSDLFLQSVESVARSFASIVNKGAIRELVDLNFDNVTNYPQLDFEGITDVDVTAISTTYQTLINAGGMTPQDGDETYFRELMGLPALDEIGIREKPATPPADQNTPPQVAASDRRSFKKKVFGDAFKPFRALTLAEEKVNYDALQSKMDELEAQFDAETKKLLHAARDEYMAAFTKAAHDGNTQGIKDATLKVQKDYARIIKQALTNALTYGKNNAANEIGTQAPPNPADMLRQIDIQADAIADAQISQITTDSKNAYVQSLNKGQSVSAALGAADAAAAASIDALTSDASAILVSGYINHGRAVTFDKSADDIYALQRSELLDPTTCNYCLSLDGRIVEKDDPFAQNTIFHSNCRGIWVAILQDEAQLPPIGGIPQSLRDRFGDAVNALIQPKTPITKKGTPARKEADRRDPSK